MDAIISRKGGSINVNRNDNIVSILADKDFSLKDSDLVPLFSFKPGYTVRSLGIFCSKGYDLGEVFYEKFKEYSFENVFGEKLKPDATINDIYMNNVKDKSSLILGYFFQE